MMCRKKESVQMDKNIKKNVNGCKEEESGRVKDEVKQDKKKKKRRKWGVKIEGAEDEKNEKLFIYFFFFNVLSNNMDRQGEKKRVVIGWT